MKYYDCIFSPNGMNSANSVELITRPRRDIFLLLYYFNNDKFETYFNAEFSAMTFALFSLLNLNCL